MKAQKKNNQLILVPTDFSEVCANAIDHAAELARYLKYKLCILHVIDKTTLQDLKKEGLSKEAIDNKLQDIANKYNGDLEVKTIAREGNIFTSIAEVAEEEGANAMVLGTHGKKGVQHITGSYAQKVVTSAPCPVFVVQKRGFKQGYKNIVFPVHDLSVVRQKVQWAVHVAKLFNSKIHLFKVNTKEDYLVEKMKLIIRQITQYFDDNKVQYEIMEAPKESGYTRQLIDYSTEIEADLVAIMTKPSVINFLITGADEEVIFNQSQIPVLCINPLELNDIVLGM